MKIQPAHQGLSRRDWAARAVGIVEADFNRSADTHLIPMPLPGFPGIDLYFKDESSHPTGSLKHRRARDPGTASTPSKPSCSFPRSGRCRLPAPMQAPGMRS